MSFDIKTNTSVKPWPLEGLEYIHSCPVCGCLERKLTYRGLKDTTFMVADGLWNLYSCLKCKSAFIDPRPNPKTIGLAYENYYTHETECARDNSDALNCLRLWRRTIANSYTNWRYGTEYEPASKQALLFGRLITFRREILDAQFRYLPKPKESMQLLDLGCGNGNFLVAAKKAGWNVLGIEMDPKAAIIAKNRGLDVRVGTIEVLDDKSELFDAITLSHVIEHFHSPLSVLKSVHRLLKPGGIIYIDTPNILSQGATQFGSSWRGFEIPRHLVLFNRASLQNLLIDTGFMNIQFKRRAEVISFMYLQSKKISRGLAPYEQGGIGLSLIDKAKIITRYFNPYDCEFVTLIAQKDS